MNTRFSRLVLVVGQTEDATKFARDEEVMESTWQLVLKTADGGN